MKSIPKHDNRTGNPKFYIMALPSINNEFINRHQTPTILIVIHYFVIVTLLNIPSSDTKKVHETNNELYHRPTIMAFLVSSRPLWVKC